MATIDVLQLLTDNYAYLVHDGQDAVVIDPADSAPVEDALRKRGLSLAGILLTHHHGDHIGGAASLARRHECPVFGPRDRRMPMVNHPLADKQEVLLAQLKIQALHTPGHTSSHQCYYLQETESVFTGDTLFAGGCGRIFEGTADEMYGSLQRLAALPEETKVWFGHEYTQENLAFACAVIPDDQAVRERKEQIDALRAMGQPTTPSTISEERKSNLFIRSEDAVAFASLRARKDHW